MMQIKHKPIKPGKPKGLNVMLNQGVFSMDSDIFLSQLQVHFEVGNILSYDNNCKWRKQE
jgi:hypothetical protein